MDREWDSTRTATDVTHPGKVWLGKDLSNTTRNERTCLFTGLMLYQGKKMRF